MTKVDFLTKNRSFFGDEIKTKKVTKIYSEKALEGETVWFLPSSENKGMILCVFESSMEVRMIEKGKLSDSLLDIL